MITGLTQAARAISQTGKDVDFYNVVDSLFQQVSQPNGILVLEYVRSLAGRGEIEQSMRLLKQYEDVLCDDVDTAEQALAMWCSVANRSPVLLKDVIGDEEVDGKNRNAVFP